MTDPLDIAALDQQLEALLELDEAARESRLQAIADDDTELAGVLRKLLGLAEEVDTLRLRAVGEAVQDASSDAPAPEIPGYRIGTAIGRGGMATVYAATRDVHGSEQRVAVKVLRTALLSAVERERFLNEQRILAQLQHPGIATLLDAGFVAGRPYMVLEHIDGRPIDQCLQAGTAQLPRILTAINQVCEALSLAHQHFIIHRDIKPGNVLVDAEGRVKLIDFGIAKILDGASWESAPTLTGATPMTLRYASPEQLLGEPVGVASDIYQLGLLAYQLLTGAWPFDQPEGGGAGERLRADALPVPASRRVADPRLRRALQGDLDAILLKCLQRRPGERYASAAGLAEDLQRHAQALPVQARRQTRGYLLRGFLRRHRLGVGVAGAILVLLLLGALSALLLAQRSAEYAQRTERILDTVTELFANANPLGGSPQGITVGELVSNTSQRFLEAEEADPLFQVLMLERLAELQRAIRNYSAEAELLARAQQLAFDHRLAHEIRSRLHVQYAESAFSRGDLQQVAALLEQPFELHPKHRAQFDYLRAKWLIERGDYPAAEVVYEKLLVALQHGDYEARFHHTVHNTRGILLRRQGRVDDAIAAYRHSLTYLDPERLDHQEALLTVPTNMAIALGVAGRYVESDAEFSRHLRDSAERLGADYPLIAHIVRNYATLLNRTGRYASAHALLQRYSAAAERGDAMLAKAAYREAQAKAALNIGLDGEAARMAVESLEMHRQVFGADRAAMASALDQVGWLLFELGDVQRAARMAKIQLDVDRQRWQRAATIVAIAQALGLHPSATAIANPPAGSCDAVEADVLHARLVLGQAPTKQVIPKDCNARRAAHLQHLGLMARAQSEPTPFAPEPLRSKFIRLGDGSGEVWPQELEAALGERVDRVLAALEGA